MTKKRGWQLKGVALDGAEDCPNEGLVKLYKDKDEDDDNDAPNEKQGGFYCRTRQRTHKRKMGAGCGEGSCIHSFVRSIGIVLHTPTATHAFAEEARRRRRRRQQQQQQQRLLTERYTQKKIPLVFTCAFETARISFHLGFHVVVVDISYSII